MSSVCGQRGRLQMRGVACGLALASLLLCTTRLWPSEFSQESLATRHVASSDITTASIPDELRVAERRAIAMAEEDLFDALMPAPEYFARVDAAEAPIDLSGSPTIARSTVAAELAAYDAIVAERLALVAAARTFVQSHERVRTPPFQWRAHQSGPRGDPRGESPPQVLPPAGCSAAGAARGQLRAFAPERNRVGGSSLDVPNRESQVSTYMGTQPVDGSIAAVVRLHFFAYRNGYHRAHAGILILRRHPSIVSSRPFASLPPLRSIHRAPRRSSAYKPRVISSLIFKPRFAQFNNIVLLTGDPA